VKGSEMNQFEQMLSKCCYAKLRCVKHSPRSLNLLITAKAPGNLVASDCGQVSRQLVHVSDTKLFNATFGDSLQNLPRKD